ncbi:hypothetical protein ABEW05_000861 [Botrytis cinerea]
MSTPFVLTSASALETPVIVIDTCIVAGNSDQFSSPFSSPFAPSLSSPSRFLFSSSSSSSSPLEPDSSSVSKFLNIPRFAMTSPSTRNLSVQRGNVGPVSMVASFTPVNSPASPGIGDTCLGVPDFAVGSPCVRGGKWSLNLSEGEGEREGAGVGGGQLMMSPVAPPNTPCSPLVLGSRDHRGSGEGEGEGEGVDGEVFIGCETGSEESGDLFGNVNVCLTRERALGGAPQIVVGFGEEGWGHLGADTGAGAGMRERCIVENWEMEIWLWS